MDSPFRIVGYVIISADGMIADRHGQMPDTLKVDADQQFFTDGLDHVDVVAHGRHSQEQQPNAARRRRLILTRKVAAIAPDPKNPLARLWNPAGASLEKACEALGVSAGVVAAIGGTDVFGLFLELGYDAFHLSRAGRAYLPEGRPVFPQVGAKTVDEVLAARGLEPGPVRVLDAHADATLVTWSKRG
jgi:dihydrofolate reductase